MRYRTLPLVLALVALPAVTTFSRPAQASEVWQPPGEDTPCGQPWVLCGNAMDFGNWANAADRVGNELEEQAAEDPIKGFIYWVAKTFGPKIPTGGGEGGDGDDDEDESTSILRSPHPKFTNVVFADPIVAKRLRKLLDRKKEGRVYRMGGVRYRLAYKREEDESRKDEFYAVLVPVQKKLKGTGKGKTHRAITLRAAKGKLYVSIPNR